MEKFPLEANLAVIAEDALLQPPWLLAEIGNNSVQPAISDKKASTSDSDIEVSLTQNKRVTSEKHWQDVRHLVFETSAQLSYEPGDILSISPKNANEDVDQIIALMGWEGLVDKLVKPRPNIDYPFPAPSHATLPVVTDKNTTLRTVLMEKIDLNAIPRRSFFSLIAHFTTDEVQRERLQEFADPELVDSLFDYTTRPRRGILEVLQEFHTVKIPWEWAIVVLPPLRARQFSIASGGTLKESAPGGTRFDLLVAVVRYKTVIRKIRRGVCTRYLESLPTESKIVVTLVKGGLGITTGQKQRPIVMIAPGTGVAPMRSLLWERLRWKDALNQSGTNGHAQETSTRDGTHNVLFFGCRNEEADYFFRDEWTELQKDISLDVFPAFSRDQQDKVYVQDLIRKHGDLVFRLLHHDDGIVYVCGSSGKMPLAVREALVDVFQKYMQTERSDAEAYLKALEKASRYKQETW